MPTEAEIFKGGSPNFLTNIAAIGAGVTIWYNVNTIWPEARVFEPCNSMIVQNNSAQQIIVYLDSVADGYAILAKNALPIRKSFRRFGIKNNGGVATVANDIIVSVSRMRTAGIPVRGAW